ncbi:AAA family ATPase, partial [Candidatus Dependentiae bacterium]|nr:AAA family ATPase [Candidatus Dependentiae bacterium]
MKIITFFYIIAASVSACQIFPGSCVLLTGPSSAGKSSLAHALKESFPAQEWCILNFGEYRRDLLLQGAKRLELIPADYVNINNIVLDCDVQKFLATLDVVTAAEKLTKWREVFSDCDRRFVEYLRECCTRQENLIIDVPLYKKGELLSLLQQGLKYFKLFFVFVHVPFNLLYQRVTERNEQKSEHEFRYLNQVIFRYFCYYHLEEQLTTRSLGCIEKNDLQAFITQWTMSVPSFVKIPSGITLFEEIVKRCEFK